MSYAIPAWAPPTVPVAGSADVFPVRHVYCVGRNYAEHAKEMGGDATKEPPFFFTKPADAVVPVVPPAVGSIAYPLATKNYHHEIELVVAIGRAGVNVAAEQANALVWGYAVGLDMTRRDLQNDMREKKRPWDIGKSFAQAAPIAPLHRVTETGLLSRGAIRLEVNGQRRQVGARRAARTALVADDPLDGQDVLLAPSDHRIVNVEQLLAEAIEFEPAVGVAINLEPRARNRFRRTIAEIEAGAFQCAKRRLAKTGFGECQRERSTLRASVRIVIDEIRLLEAEPELDLAELCGLEAGSRPEHMPELQIVDGSQRRKHVPR